VGSQENQQTRTLDDVLAGFDVRADPFDYHDVAGALRLLASELKASGTAASPAMYAERLAFDFTENYHGDTIQMGSLRYSKDLPDGSAPGLMTDRR
jgi:hypothetical protein